MKNKNELRNHFKADLPEIRKLLLKDRKNKLTTAFKIYALAHTRLHDSTVKILAGIDARIKSQRAAHKLFHVGFSDFQKEASIFEDDDEYICVDEDEDE